MFVSTIFSQTFCLNKLYNEHQNVHLFHFLKPIKHTLMTSEQPEKYAYCENENNQNAILFLLKNSECFWIKFELCLEIMFYD